MKLATLKNGQRDGLLVVVSRDNTRWLDASEVAPTLQAALDSWELAEPGLQALAHSLEADSAVGSALDTAKLMAPLPRAYEWVDGSAYLNHVRLVRKARNAEPPATLETDPLVYQGGSGVLLGPQQAIELPDANAGLDFESELCVVLGDTPRGTASTNASDHIRLVMLCNDVTLRNLIPRELGKGFGFFQSKPATAFSPFAVTPDELGENFREGRVHLNVRTRLNGEVVGAVDAGPEMHFGFHDLIEHIASTRSFTAGTILGSGTVSNSDKSKGISCLSELRMREIIEEGAPRTAYLQAGDRVQIDVHDVGGRNVFGTIDQQVVSA
jgi:fumarylacetoacetate (FAA) hydrolase